MNLLSRSRILACGLAVAAAGGFAWGQNLPAPGPNATVQSVQVAPGPGIFRPDTDGGLKLPPDMPPLDKIPPMPMDAGGFRGGPLAQSAGHMVMFDAATGETTRTNVSIVKPAEEEVSGGGFTGLYPVGPSEQGDTNWNSTNTTVSDALLTTWPYRANCKVAMRRLTTGGATAWYVCSGTMIDAETVLMAGHCVYTHTAGLQQGWAEEIYVFPGWDGAGSITAADGTIINAWGFASGTSYGSWSTWTNSADFDGDVGLVKVNRAVGMLTGWYGWNHSSSCATIQSRTYNNVSYPAENCGGALHTGAQMYYWFGQIDSCPGNQLQIDTNSGCTGAVWGGMSGSSMYFIDGDLRYASAVCSTSNRVNSASYCRLFSGFVDFMNDTIIPDARGTTLDLQALDCDISDTTWAADTTVTGFSFIASNPTNNDPLNQTYAYNIYLSTNTDISTSDTLLSQQTFTHNYVAMQSLRVNSSGFTLPVTVPPGTYYLGAVLDTGTGGDTNSGNNDSDTWDAVRITVSACTDPPFPSGVVSANREFCDRNELNWNDMAGATSYQVWRNTTNNSATATLRTTIAAPTNIYNDFTASLGTLYFYWVKAIYPCGTSDFSLVADGERNEIPVVPVNVSATDSSVCSSVNVTWTPSALATNYRIYRGGTTTGADATYIANDTTSPYVDSTGIDGALYYYFVRAENACGISGYSAANAGSATPAPGVPSGLTASNGTSCSLVLLDWNNTLFADSYTVWRNTSNNSFLAVLVGSPAGSSFNDAPPLAGTSYFYWVKSVNECGASGFSAVAQGSRRSLPASAPTGVIASDSTNCPPAITISWNSALNTDSYKVYRNTVNNSGTSTLIASGIAATTYDDATAAPNTLYFFWVRASNACGDSGFSATDSGTRGGAPGVPTSVLATDGTQCRSVVVTWTAPAGATSFQIWRSTVNNSGTAAVIGLDTASPYIDGTVVGPTVYFYWVKAVSLCGTSGFSTANSGFGGTTSAFSTQPADLTVFEGNPAVFSVDIGGATSYQWRKGVVNLVNGPNITGATTDTLTILSAAESDEGNYSVRVGTPCGTVISNSARLTVDQIPCPADFNMDGGIDGADVQAFFDEWEAGNAAGDVNQDGGIDGADVDYFFQVWEAGGC